MPLTKKELEQIKFVLKISAGLQKDGIDYVPMIHAYNLLCHFADHDNPDFIRIKDDPTK